MSRALSLEDIFPNLLRDDRDADRWQARGVREGFVSGIDAQVHAIVMLADAYVTGACGHHEQAMTTQRVRVFGVVAGHKVCRECVREIEKGIARA